MYYCTEHQAHMYIFCLHIFQSFHVPLTYFTRWCSYGHNIVLYFIWCRKRRYLFKKIYSAHKVFQISTEARMAPGCTVHVCRVYSSSIMYSILMARPYTKMRNLPVFCNFFQYNMFTKSCFRINKEVFKSFIH